MFEPEEAAVDMPVTITDVIRQNEDGSGSISVTSGDVSVPVSVFFQKNTEKRCFFIQFRR